MTPPSPDLARLELLQAFKRRTPLRDSPRNVSPFEDRVVTAQGEIGGSDREDVHGPIRQRVRHTIEAVGAGRKKSQVVLLAGAAGSGKTHLLRSFQTPDLAAQVGYVFVGGSNHWALREFPARLLDWVIGAVTDPSPADDHLLLERVRAIGFRAVGQLLANPIGWRPCLARAEGGWFGRRLGRLRAPTHDALTARAEARDPTVFAAFDFAAFSAYVCDRFLADRSNPTHRYALRVLLTYLFPDRHETGVGSREKVLHWFRDRGDPAYFTRRLGAAERLDRTFGQFEAVKLLAHLFSPAVSAELSTPAATCPPRVFLLVFDQAEGRNELFDGDDDWKDFFAHLSELYNSLPNVVVVFTMTLHLRNRLHALMERQFQDRILMDKDLILGFPTDDQWLGLYRARIEGWLRADPDLLDRYRAAADPFVPFTRDEVVQLAGGRSIREAFERLDAEFRGRLDHTAVDALHDYHYRRNQLFPLQASQSEWEYTADHLDTVSRLLALVGADLAAERGVRIARTDLITLDHTPVLKVWLQDPGGRRQVLVSVARVGKNYTKEVGKLIDLLLANQWKDRNLLWVVRPKGFDTPVPDRCQSQVKLGEAAPETEVTFRALCHVAGNREAYAAPAQRQTYDELVRGEVRRTYLGALFERARTRLDAMTGEAEPTGQAVPVEG